MWIRFRFLTIRAAFSFQLSLRSHETDQKEHRDNSCLPESATKDTCAFAKTRFCQRYVIIHKSAQRGLVWLISTFSNFPLADAGPTVQSFDCQRALSVFDSSDSMLKIHNESPYPLGAPSTPHRSGFRVSWALMWCPSNASGSLAARLQQPERSSTLPNPSVPCNRTSKKKPRRSTTDTYKVTLKLYAAIGCGHTSTFNGLPEQRRHRAIHHS